MPAIVTTPATVRQLEVVEMVAQGSKIAVTLSPHELELRVKLPADISDSDRFAVLATVNMFREKYADTLLKSSYRGSALIHEEGVKINVKNPVDSLSIVHKYNV